jgi:hypothetical protein
MRHIAKILLWKTYGGSGLIVFAAGDKGVLRWSGVMKHTGDAIGMAIGRMVRRRGMTLVRFAGGKVVESWDNWDQLGMLQQIGALRPPVAA